MAACPKAESCEKVYEISIVRVKPKYLMNYLQCLPQGIAIFEKHGAKLCGHWLVESGAAHGPEIVFFTEHDSLDGRNARKEQMMMDPEFHKFIGTQGRFIYDVEDYVCFSVPGLPCNPCSPGRRIIMEQFECKAFPVYSVGKLGELFEMWNKYVDPNSPKPIGFFRPMAFSKNALFGLFPASDDGKLQPIYNTYKKMAGEAKNWPKMAEVFDAISATTARVMVPIKSELIPPPGPPGQEQDQACKQM